MIDKLHGRRYRSSLEIFLLSVGNAWEENICHHLAIGGAMGFCGANFPRIMRLKWFSHKIYKQHVF